MNQESEKPLPVCKSIILCELANVDASTNKISLLDLIGAIALPTFPARAKPMSLFLHLVDGIGDWDISVQAHDLRNDEVVFRSKAVKISFPDRLAPRRLVFTIRGLPFPHAGRYDLIVFGNDQEIERLQIRAVPATLGER